jgi:hypothetical protein
LGIVVFHVCDCSVQSFLPHAQPNQEDSYQYSKKTSAIQKLFGQFAQNARIADASVSDVFGLLPHASLFFDAELNDSLDWSVTP